jgi:hypothetical protein
MNWLPRFFEVSKDDIIDRWLELTEQEYPLEYVYSVLRKNGSEYFKLLKDEHIPVEEHPSFQIIVEMCQYYAVKKTPTERVMHSGHLWRKVLLESIGDYTQKHQVDWLPSFLNPTS